VKRSTPSSKVRKTVLTFVGYPGAGYEDQASMLQQAERIRGEFDPESTIVNIGATAEDVGAIYELAKRKGFVTAGIVSARERPRKTAADADSFCTALRRRRFSMLLKKDGKHNKKTQEMYFGSSRERSDAPRRYGASRRGRRL
jgi:hypothetical protein